MVGTGTKLASLTPTCPWEFLGEVAASRISLGDYELLVFITDMRGLLGGLQTTIPQNCHPRVFSEVWFMLVSGIFYLYLYIGMPRRANKKKEKIITIPAITFIIFRSHQSSPFLDWSWGFSRRESWRSSLSFGRRGDVG